MRRSAMPGRSISAPTVGPRLRAAAACCEPIAYDLLALVARLCVGAMFWQSGQTKIVGWHLSENAVYLFRTEYQLPLIDPWLAAVLTAFIENVFSILLIVGLASRFTAFGLFCTTLVIELFVYPDAWALHGTWAVCLGLVMVRGAGVASVDHWLARAFSRRA